MKRFIAILLSVMLLLTMAACGGKTENIIEGSSAAETVEKPDTSSAPVLGMEEPIRYNLGYDDGRILECSINVNDYIYEKDGEYYADLEKIITDAGWEVNKVPGFEWIPQTTYYGDEYIVRLLMGKGEDPFRKIILLPL